MKDCRNVFNKSGSIKCIRLANCNVKVESKNQKFVGYSTHSDVFYRKRRVMSDNLVNLLPII